MSAGDQGKLAECVTRPEDRDRDELAAAQRYPHADMTGRDQVESVGRVALMKDHLIAPVGLAPQPRDQVKPLVLRQRRQNRPVHDFTMPSRAASDHRCHRRQATDAWDVSSPASAEWP
jgi:hypothetical protein